MKLKELSNYLKSHIVIISMAVLSLLIVTSIVYDVLVARPDMRETLDRLEVKIDNISNEIDFITPRTIADQSLLVIDTVGTNIPATPVRVEK